jgi:hypothetical protein
MIELTPLHLHIAGVLIFLAMSGGFAWWTWAG